MIKKITDLILSECFIQADAVKGYKYVDKAGEIVNMFHKDDLPPRFSMDYNGLVILKPTSGMAELKVTPDVFWSHFIEPDSLDLIFNLYTDNCIEIFKILDVEKIKRLGWRNYFIKEFNTDKEREKVFEKFKRGDNLMLEQALFTFENDKITYNVRIRKVSKNDTSKLSAIMFDIDSFRVYKNFLEVKQIRKELQDIKNGIRSEKLVDAINALLE